MAYEWVLGNAREYVYFQTPYFVPPASFLLALKAAALRGVDVRVMLSKNVDTPILGPFNRGYYTECLEAGVKIIEADGQFNHSKTMVADDYLSVVGATNLDVRSFTINNEVNSFIFDRETALGFKDAFHQRLVGAKEWTLESWIASRTLREIIVSNFVRLFYREF
jgi:cardiolipin synthase